MKKYLICLAIGGLMEDEGRPFRYEQFQVIEAESEDEATKIYNEKNNCSYFYGTCVAYKGSFGETIIKNKNITLNQIELLDK